MASQFTKLYEVLGFEGRDLENTASIDQASIKQAYRSLAKKWHPDLNANSPESHEMMGQLSAAYEVLGDPERRVAYDRDGTGEEGLAAAHIEIVGMEMFMNIIDNLLYTAPEMSQASIMAAMMQGKEPPQPVMKEWTEESLLEAALELIDKAETEAVGKIQGAEKELATLEKTISKVKWQPQQETEDTPGHRQAKSFNPLGGLLNKHKQRLEHLIETGYKIMEELAACRDMLAHYDFEYEEPTPTASPEPQTFGDFLEDLIKGREIKVKVVRPADLKGGVRGKSGHIIVDDLVDLDPPPFEGDADYTDTPTTKNDGQAD